LRVLLDECVDVRLAAGLAAVDVRTVADQGWLGISNGQLLALAAAEFDVFVTVDRNLPFQQHLPKFDIAVILLRAKTNRLDDLVLLVPGEPRREWMIWINCLRFATAQPRVAQQSWHIGAASGRGSPLNSLGGSSHAGSSPITTGVSLDG